MAADGQEPHGGFPGAVCVAADGQEPHDGLPGAVCLAADGQEPHGGLPGVVGLAAVDQEPRGGLPGAVCVASNGQEPHGSLPVATSVAVILVHLAFPSIFTFLSKHEHCIFLKLNASLIVSEGSNQTRLACSEDQLVYELSWLLLS